MNADSDSGSTPAKERELTPKVRRTILLANVIPLAVGVAILWVLFISERVFHFDLAGLLRGHPKDWRELDQYAWPIWVPLAVTLGAALFAVYQVRRATNLARRGVEVVATVERLGKVSMIGLVRLDYSYTFNDQVFRKSFSCEKSEAAKYQDGTKQLIVVCDPLKPKRCMQRFQVGAGTPPA